MQELDELWSSSCRDSSALVRRSCCFCCHRSGLCPSPTMGCQSLLPCSALASLEVLTLFVGSSLDEELGVWAPCACLGSSEGNLSHWGFQLGVELLCWDPGAQELAPHTPGMAADGVKWLLSTSLMWDFRDWFSVCSVMFSGGSYFHVGFLLRVAEWSHGYRSSAWPAGSLWGRGWPLQVHTKHRILSISSSCCSQHQHCLQSLWTLLLSFQEKSEYISYCTAFLPLWTHLGLTGRWVCVLRNLRQIWSGWEEVPHSEVTGNYCQD